VQSLARCEGRLRRNRCGAQKRRRFMLPRTLPAVIIGAFISATLPSERSSSPVLSLDSRLHVSRCYFRIRSRSSPPPRIIGSIQRRMIQKSRGTTRGGNNALAGFSARRRIPGRRFVVRARRFVIANERSEIRSHTSAYLAFST